MIDKKRCKLILFSIILLSLALRVYKLDSKVIWYDEADSVASATRELTFFQDKEVVYKPLYFLLLKAWIGVFGVSAVCLRFLSVILGVLSVFFMYLLCKEVFEKEGIALLSSFFLAISPFQVYQSQQVRQFTLLTLLSLVSFYFLVLYYKHGKIKFLALNFFSNILLLATYPIAAFVLLSQILIVLFRQNAYRKAWLALTCAFFGFYSLGFLFSSLNISKEMTWWVIKPGLSTIRDMFSAFVTGGDNYGRGYSSLYKGVYSEFRFLKIIDIIGLMVAVPLFIKGILLSARGDFIRKGLLFYFFLTLTGAFLVSYSIVSIFVVKNLAIIMPVFIFTVVYGLFSLRPKERIFSALLLSSVSVYSLIAVYNLNLDINWKIPAEFIKQNGRRGDAVVLATDKEVAAFLYYFRPQNKGVLSDIGYWGKLNDKRYQDVFDENGYRFFLIKENRDNSRTQLQSDFLGKMKAIGDNKRIWLLVSDWVLKDERSFMKNSLRDQGREVSLETREQGLNMLLFVSKN
ncbi:MAG: glycosyltransferase family 39 protein [Candidatus Omnitrophica bacterium]|nr:glycosyltransferase family 39 protein [Candidatus Omnitrophota bacterium]